MERGKSKEMGWSKQKEEWKWGPVGFGSDHLNYLTPLGRSEDKQLSAIVTSGKLVAS